jgi:hypothetical protein
MIFDRFSSIFYEGSKDQKKDQRIKRSKFDPLILIQGSKKDQSIKEFSRLGFRSLFFLCVSAIGGDGVCVRFLNKGLQYLFRSNG